MIRLALLFCAATPAWAEIVVPARTIPARSLIAAEDLVFADLTVPGAVALPDEIVGMEARVALYAGRPIRPEDIALPAIVERNQIIPLVYDSGGLVIMTEGRALDRAGPGDVIEIMNLASRNTVTARVGIDGAAYVAQ
jgi:flagellar basal body P-ring formation protein FlgA